MFNSVDEYDKAIAAQAVKMVEWGTLCRKYPKFISRSRQTFEEFLLEQKQSITTVKVRGHFVKYVRFTSQEMYGAWTEALLFIPALRRHAERSAERELALFRIYLRTLGYEHNDPFDGLDDARAEVMLQWHAWNKALDFGYTL